MEKHYCPKCSSNTNHEILFQESMTSDIDDDFSWKEIFRIITCLGCENLQFQRVYGDESMVETVEWDGEIGVPHYYTESFYYPPYIKEHKMLRNVYDIPEKIRLVYFETLECIKSNNYILAGAGLRAVIEAITIDQSIKGKDLAQKIDKLANNKLITEKDAKRLHTIRFLGNDSIHEMEVPQVSKINTALVIVEKMINDLYLLDIEIDKHLDTIINTYDDFKNLVLKNTIDLIDEKIIKLKDILGKDFRRIEPSYYNNFEDLLINDIKSNKVTSLKLDKAEVENSKFGEIKVQYYKIFHEKVLTGFSPYNKD